MARKLKQSVINSIPHLKENLNKRTQDEEKNKRKLKQSVYESMPYLNEEEDDIAPVSTERTWLKRSEGGWVDTVLGSGTDLIEHGVAGLAGIGEKLFDSALTIASKNNEAELMRTAQRQAAYDALSGKKDADKIIDEYRDIAKEGEKGVSEIIKKDLYDEEAIARTLISDNMRKIGVDSERNSIFGEKSDALAMSAGQLGGQVLSNMIAPGSGMVMMGASAFGSEMESGLRNGATFNEAGLSATISAGAEILSEKLGGVKFGGKSLTDAVFGEMSSRVTSKLARALVSAGKITVDALAEGGEELFSGYMSAVGQKMSYMKDAEIEELFSDEDKLESFIGGVVLGGTFSGVETAVTGRDAASELTRSEQAVVDKVANDTIAQREAKGEKLSGGEKAKIRKDVVEQMEKGQLDIDTIESVLGGDKYKAYTDHVNAEEKLKTELDELSNIEKGKLTRNQEKRIEELEGMKLDDTTKRDGLRASLDKAISPMLKNSKLAESYRERERRGQAFETDLSKYTGKQREAVERAVKSGVLNNTYRSHELVNVLSKLEADKGIVFDYMNNEKLKESGFAVEGKIVNGFANKSKGTVTLNVQSAKAWQSVVGHEITHVLEGTDAYSELRSALYAYANSKGELDSKRAALTELYQNMDADVEAELTADLVGDYLFSDKDFINRLTGNRTLFEKVYDEIKYLYKVATGKERASMERIMHDFDKAWEQLSIDRDGVSESDDSGEGDVDYSISVTDAETLDSLNKQVARGEYDAETNPDGGYYVTYKSMSFWGYDEDGNAILRSPMAEYVDGELSNAYLIPKDKNKLNWYQATETIDEGTGLPSGLLVKTRQEGKKSFSYLPAAENQDLIAEDWSNLYFNLRKKIQKKGKWVNSDVPARYNPYEHSSNSMLNDQFTAAYQRDNLVTVKMYVPISEDNGAYRAKWSKDPTGWSDWKSGIVAGKIAKQKDLQRRVYLSRYAAPVEIVPDSEVAQAYKSYLEGTDVAIPDNVVSPNLLNELRKAGVPIEESGKVQYSVSADSDANYISSVDRYSDMTEKSVFRTHFMESNRDMMNAIVKNRSQTKTENFKKWFGESVVTNKDGEPLLVYRGASSNNAVLDHSQKPIWFSNNVMYAETYSEEVKWSDRARRSSKIFGGANKKVIPAYISIENPADFGDTDAVFSDSLMALSQKLGIAEDDMRYVWEKNGRKEKVWETLHTSDMAALLSEYGYDGATAIENGCKTWCVFDSRQVKSAVANNGKFDPDVSDIRFSLSKSVEETKDLMALHNLQSSELAKTLELGGLPMPSIAVIKDTMSHEQYGDVSLILPKEAIDPAANKDNKVYGGDAWTPTYPKIEYKPNEKVAKKISDKYYGLAKVIGYDEIRPMYRYVNELEDALNRDGGEAAMLEKLYDDTDMMNLYLQDSGKGKVEPITRETVTKISDAQAEMNQWFIDALGEDFIASFKAPDGVIPMKHRSAFMEQNEEKIRDTYKRYFAEEHGFTAEEIENVFENIGKRDLMTIMRDAYLYMQNKGVTVRTETDSAATNDAIREAASDGYKEWVDGLFKGIEEKSGIRNNQDYYTRSGNPRSWDALHWENTLENVVKVMKGQDETGVGSFSPFNTLFGSSHKRYGSIQEIKADSGRLGVINQDDYDAMKDSFSERFAAIATSIKDPGERNAFIATDTAAEQIIEAVRTKKTKTGILNHLKALNSRANMQTVEEVLSLVSDIANMPTGYFEAKPQRAVGLEEVGVFVIPRNADVKLKQELLNRGYSIAEYDPNIEGDRQRVVNGFEEYKFSLSNVGEESAPVGNYSTPLKDLALEKDIAPVVTDTNVGVKTSPAPKAALVKVAEEYTDNYVPVTEEEADALSKARYETITDADAPPEMPAPYYEGGEIEPIDPFENRDMKEVGSQRVKAYMYENPEVKPFFQEEAEIMLGDLYRSQKGERVVDAEVLYETNGEAGVWGVSRHTAPDIAELLDEWGYTYAEIENGLKAIIEDNGKENNACSKRIEFMLNDRLMNGYQDFFDGYEIPGNQEYINLVKEKGITEYNEEAWKRYSANIESYIPPIEEDIAPTMEIETEAPFPDEIAPMTEAEANAIQDAKAEADKAAEGLPKTRKQLHKNILDNVKATFSSIGFDFDEVLRKAKNLSTFSTVDNTPQRVMEKALGYKEGQVLADLTVNRVAQNESQGIKWLNSFTDRKSGLLAQISKQYRIKPGSKESAAAQMYAEGFYVNDNNDIIAYGDKELAQDFPDVGTQYRIKGLASDPRIRQIYDETLEAINKSRARNAYPEIQKLDNYFLHFRAMDDTFSKLGLPFNPNDIRAKDLPTDLNGVTADLKPGQPYFASAMHRTGKRTSFDLLGGLERYLTSAKNQIYHIDDIQTLRALRNYIADTYGQANGLEGIDALSEEEAQEKIEMVYGSHLSTFAKFLNEEANVLAGKTALIDRGLEGIIGRRGMTFLDTVNRQVGSNMVGFNISSSLTNFLPVAQTFAKSNKFDFTKAFAQTVSNKFGSIFGKGDGFAENSPVIIRRKGSDRFYRTPWQKAGDAGYVLMSAVDDISTELIARTKYNELTRKGMDEQAAHFETDKWVSRLMGDRSLGQQPQLYNSKTLGVLTKFQLEVRNQLDSQFYDTIQEAKVSTEDVENALVRNAKAAAKITSTFVQLAAVQHLYGKAFESVAGYNPAFDIISTLATMFGWDDEEESEDTVLDNVEQGFLALLEDLPYTSTFTGGRIPIASALPITELVKGVDQYGNEKSRLETLGDAAPYYVLPGGYGQIKKTATGLNMFSDEHPVSGSYTDSGKLRFPVEDTPLNRAQAAIFGQYASKNAREYFDNDYAPLNEKQIQEYIDVDMPIKDYRKYREGLKGLTKNEEKFDYISGLDLPIDKKNILINNVVDRKEPVDLTNYDDFSSLEEFDFATKSPDKYAFAKSVGGYSAYKTYSKALDDLHADKDAKGKSISGSRKEKVLDYINNLDADYYTKIILYKSEYPSDDTYNSEIVNHITNLSDFTREEKVALLTELGFRVAADGQIYAD